MKTATLNRAAVLESLSDFGRKRKTVSKIPALHVKSNTAAQTARKLAELYHSITGGYDGFAEVYKMVALQLDSSERRKLHRNFAEVIHE